MPIGKTEAVASAEANAAGLRQHRAWLGALDGATAAFDPVKVLLDAGGSETPFYFIVTFQRGTLITARMAIHADTGELREAQGVEQTGSQLRAFVNPLSVALTALGSPPTVEPDLFWRPCRQSTSMLQPFFVVNSAARKFFVRVDGTVFERLDAVGHG